MGFYGTNGCGCLVWCSNDGQKLAIAQYEDNDQATIEANALNERIVTSIFPATNQYSTLGQ